MNEHYRCAFGCVPCYSGGMTPEQKIHMIGLATLLIISAIGLALVLVALVSKR